MKNHFKSMSNEDLEKNALIRKSQLDLVTLEILYYKAKIKQLKKKESLLWQRWMTVQHWINSRKSRGLW